MYKIHHFLIILALTGPGVLRGQSVSKPNVWASQPPPKTASNSPTGLLQSGPMVGYSDMREVMLWAQTKEAAKIQIRYHEAKKASPVYLTNAVNTHQQAAFTAHLLANQVDPGKKYAYELRIGGQKVSLPYPTRFQTQNLWQWRADPPAFRFAVGSCTYVNGPDVDLPGTPYGGGIRKKPSPKAATCGLMS